MKNSVQAARAKFQKGLPPGGAAAAELAVYAGTLCTSTQRATRVRMTPPSPYALCVVCAAACRRLRAIGVQVAAESTQLTVSGMEVFVGPMVVIDRRLSTSSAELRALFPFPERIHISATSTLIIRGAGVRIESLELDGALVVTGFEGPGESKTPLTLRELRVHNNGWAVVPLRNDEACDESVPEHVRIRGYDATLHCSAALSPAYLTMAVPQIPHREARDQVHCPRVSQVERWVV